MGSYSSPYRANPTQKLLDPVLDTVQVNFKTKLNYKTPPLIALKLKTVRCLHKVVNCCILLPQWDGCTLNQRSDLWQTTSA
jgi:hypothetical protein